MESRLGAGSVIAGKYRLVAPVAEGGMGAVWRAEDLQLAAPVALKLLHSRNLDQRGARARFEAEAAIGAQLRSPHVVQIFEMGLDRASNVPFIAMELLEGESLQDRLARTGPMAPRELVRVVSQVARALTRAHGLGIIHRDLKPANIFLVRDGETQLAKVLDFGIAKRLVGNAGGARTLTGELLGTPTYMSPEQLLGSRDVDHRSDLWSLGVIAVECLTGRLPFEADHLAGLALAICQGRHLPPSSLGAVPPGFDAWFDRATAASAEARFDSAAQLAKALREICGGEPREPAEPAAASARDGAVEVSTWAGLGLAPDRTVQLPRPQRQLLGRARRWRLWGALGAGALLVFLALRVRLPEAGRPRLAPPPGKAVLSNVPLPREAPPAAEPAPRAAAPPSPPAGAFLRPPASAAPLSASAQPQPHASRAPSSPPPAEALAGVAPEPAAGMALQTAPRSLRGTPSPEPAPQRLAPSDPDNLGF